MNEAHIHQYEIAGLKERSWFARLRNRLTSGILSGGGIGSAIAVCARLSGILGVGSKTNRKQSTAKRQREEKGFKKRRSRDGDGTDESCLASDVI